MRPLSCVNCCHNPLQLGLLGTSFGYCTRHQLILSQAEATTCGQLLRKDLLAPSANREQAIHRRSYPVDRVVLVASPEVPAGRELVQKPNGHMPSDPVVEEVLTFGTLDTRIATMAALHRILGPRAEAAMLSLSRGYVRNCLLHGGQWTAGLHLLHWTLKRLDHDPAIGATEIRGPIARSVDHTTAIARWSLITFRLAFVADVALAAGASDPVGRLSRLAGQAAATVPGGDADRLLAWLKAKRPSWSRSLSDTRYAELRAQVHHEVAAT